METLLHASETSWLRDQDGLWVKLVVTNADFQGPVLEPIGQLVVQTTITVGRHDTFWEMCKISGPGRGFFREISALPGEGRRIKGNMYQ